MRRIAICFSVSLLSGCTLTHPPTDEHTPLGCVASTETPRPYIHWTASTDPDSLRKQRETGWGQEIEGFRMVDFHGRVYVRSNARLYPVSRLSVSLEGHATWARLVSLVDGIALFANPVETPHGRFAIQIPVMVSKRRSIEGGFQVFHSGLTKLTIMSEGCNPLSMFVSLDQPATTLILDAASSTTNRE